MVIAANNYTKSRVCRTFNQLKKKKTVKRVITLIYIYYITKTVIDTMHLEIQFINQTFFTFWKMILKTINIKYY